MTVAQAAIPGVGLDGRMHIFVMDPDGSWKQESYFRVAAAAPPAACRLILL